MNILKLRTFLKREEGNVFIWVLIIIPILLSFSGLFIDRITISYIKARAKDSVTYALEAGAKEHIVLENNTVIFKRPDAELKVYEYLRKNLDLNTSFEPNSNNTYIAGKVEMKELILLDPNTSSYPYTCPITNKKYNYPTIHIHLVIPIKLMFMKGILGISDELKLPVHVDVSTEDFL